MKLEHLQVNHMFNPFVDGDIEFSWRIKDNKNDVEQIAYKIDVFLDNLKVWSSLKVNSSKQSFIEYKGELKSNKEYKFVVTVWNNYNEKARKTSYFSTAFLSSNEWMAKFIESPFSRNKVEAFVDYNTYNRVVDVKKEFKVEKEIKKAKLYASSYGAYRPYLNKKRINDSEFAPGFTPYDKILNYQVYDIKNLLKVGNNTLNILLGDGWYFCPQTEVVTSFRHAAPSTIFELHIEFDDGSKKIIYSDGSEVVKQTEILNSDIFQGERVDLLANNEEYLPVILKDYDKSILKVQKMDDVKIIEILKPINILTSPKGETIIDFGQIIAGRVMIKLKEEKGTKISIEHTESLDKDGNFTSLIPQAQRDEVICDGKHSVFEPIFTFHGFRYIKVIGIKNPTLDMFEAHLLSTKKENASTFICNNEMFNKLYKNIRYSQKNNMMSIPTDCPQREKAGWTGDIQLYSENAMLEENMTPFLTSYLECLKADQDEYGVIPIISPFTNMYNIMVRQVMGNFKEHKIIDVAGSVINGKPIGDVLEGNMTNVAGWSDAIIYLPYNMYKITGNKLCLKKSYTAIKKFMEQIINEATHKKGTKLNDEIDKYLWDTGFHFGEWLIPGRCNNGFNDCLESSLYVSSMFGYKDCLTVAKIAKILGNNEDYNYYLDISNKMKYSIQNGLMKEDLLPHDLMGAYVLAFAFDLVPSEYYDEYKNRLVSLIHKNNDCLQTGFLATPYLLDVLVKLDENELAKTILNQTKCPSWLYEVKMGATSIWENWDCYEEDGNPKRVSFDHYAFGVVDTFIHKVICGINSVDDGYHDILIKPDLSYGITSFKREYISEAGKISVEVNDDKLIVEIPVNTKATILWKGNMVKVGSGIYTF